MSKEREYLVCTNAAAKSNKLTVGKIYIAEGNRQRCPVHPTNGKRDYYTVTSDGGLDITLYGYRFKVLKKQESTNAM